MVFDLDEYMKQGEQQVKKNNDEFDLDVFLQQSGDNVIETPTAPVQKQKTARTYANQDISNMNPDEFRKNVDNLYDIPQVPMPSRHNAGYSNSDGEFRENLPTFAENHPVLNSVFNGIKQLPENAYNAISNIGNITQNAQPQVQYNGDTPLLTGGVSKKSFLNDQRYWLKTKANKFGDALLRIASNMGNSNPYGNLQPVQNPVKTTTNKNGQKIIDYSQESPMEQKIAGSRADYEKLKDIRSNPEKYSQTYNENDYEAVKNSYLQGNIDYKTAKNIYDQYNTANKNASEAARVVSEDAQRKIKNIEVGEAMLDTAFWGTLAFNILLPGAANIPTVGGKIVTGNLKNAVKKEATKRLMAEGFTKESAAAFVEEASKAGLVDRGVQVGLENYSKDMLAKYGINNAAGELAGKVATNAALAGTAGAIDMGLLSGGLNQYTNYLGVTDNNPLESVVGGAGQGALFAGALGGASPVLSQIAKSIGNMPIGKSYEPLKNSVDIYRGQNNSYNLSNGVGTGFTMGEGSPLQYADRMPQDVQYNGAENIQQIAPKTFEKMQAENAELPQANEVEQPQMSAKEQKRAEAKRSVIDRIKELAPKTAENIEKSPSEKSNDFYQLFKKHQFVKDNEGNVYESHVNQNGYIRNVDTDEHSAGDMKRTYEPYIPDEKEFVKKQEFKYEPNAKFDTNSHNYAFSQQEVVDAYNNYIKSPTVENREIYQDTYGEKTEEFHQKEEEFKNQIQKIAPKTAKKIQQEQAVEQKPKQYKVVNGKTVEVGSEAEKIANMAPKTAEKLRVKKGEKLQANNTAKQESNADDADWKETLKKRDAVDYEIVARAASTKYGKQYSMREIKMLIGAMRNGNTYKNGLHKRAEKFFEFIQQPDDRITSGDSVTTIPGARDFYSDNMSDEELINQAINNLLYNRTKPVDPYEKAFAELDTSIDNFRQNLQNMKSLEEADAVLAEFEKLDEYGSLVSEDLYNDLAGEIDAKFNELKYNDNKGIDNEKIDTNVQRKNIEQTGTDNGAEKGTDDIRSGQVQRSDTETEGNQQVAIKGLEEESAKSVQKQQDEVTAKENKEKYSTTQGGKQNQMFNTEQFKNGQQMLFDTSDMPKNTDNTSVVEIPEDYKTQVKNYSKEEHLRSADILGDRMAAAAKKANAGIGKDDNGEQYKTYSEKFEEYKAYKEWHEEQAKNLDKNETKQVTDQVKQKENTSKSASKKNEPNNSIQDSGEFLRGNRKANDRLTWDELQEMNEVVRAKNLTKAKIYKKPTLESLQEQGLGQYQSALAMYVYNHIAAKAPTNTYKLDEDQKMYVDNIPLIMDKVIQTLKENPDELTWEFVNDNYSHYYAAKNGYIAKESNKLLNAIFPDKDNKVGRYDNIFRVYPEYSRLAKIMGGDRFVKALQIRKSNTKEIEKIWDSFNAEKKETAKKEDWEKNFTILEPDRYNKKYQIGTAKKKNGYYHIVGGEFDTREEAVAFAKKLTEMQAQAKAELKKANFERDYVKRRDKDITSDELRESFGFKGVNFGNYVNQKERQDFLNYAYDSLFDLAELLNLPPKALSLNGRLGLAFGAQGNGGRAAGHYIPDYQEINMTKDSGAGVLAHEWWHALDNYFGYMSQGKDYSLSYGTDIKEQGNLRPEVFNTLKDLFDKIKNVPLTEKEITERKNNIIARCERNIKYYADEVKNTFRNVEGVADFVDNLVKNKDKYIHKTDEEMHNLCWKEFAPLIPEKRQTIQNMARLSWLTGEIQRIGRAEEIASSGMGKTEYYKSAEKLNEIERMGSVDYWTQPTELGARAFTTWLLDKMETMQMVNKFLSRSQGGEVSFDFRELAKELQSGEEKKSIIYWNPKEPEEKARIFDAFNKLFDTIKTRETDKGVEIYDIDIPEFMKTAKEVDTGHKDIDLTPIYAKISDGITGEELAKMLPEEIGEAISGSASNYTFGEMITNNSKKKGVHVGKKSAIKLNLDAIGNSPYKFVETLLHEVEHATQRKMHLQIMAKPKTTWTPEERTFVAHYNICKRVNNQLQKYYNRHSDLIDKFDKSNFYSAEERANAISQLNSNEQKIIDTYDQYFAEYWEAEHETNARAKGVKNAAGYRKESGYTLSKTIGKKQADNEASTKRHLLSNNGFNTLKSNKGISTNRQRLEGIVRGNQEVLNSIGLSEFKQNPEKPTTTKTTNKDTSEGIRQAARDKVYQWHGDIESDRYDVDKSLNSFINLTKQKARDFSKKFGFNITDTQIREIMPFLRERTGLPKNLNRPELTKLYDALSDAEKKELTKLADNLSDKFEKYYKNYQDTKGEQSAESIENHISHIWDLDKKKKSLLTNYITTNSRFAKKRTIGTLAEGIDGIEINGEKVQFKPKTLDYAEILKSSSDNLIKAAHDSVLANEIKNLRYQDKPLVLPASKAPEEWIEVSHPALNKAVYMGAVGENELPMLMKTPVKVHPEIADYVSSIFEVQKNSDFWNTYDSLNGMIKQLLLGFSGFHGYALSESSIGNAGVMKTMQELNPKKFVDAIKNGNYDIYKNEEAAKRAINAGVQLGTPSDLQRNLVEETLKKIPFVGRYIAGGVSANNKILWDVLHNNFKILAFNTAIENIEAAAKRKATVEEERTAAQWVNDSFGGQAWELLGIKNSAIKAAGRILLSPDWNFSTIRQAAAAINSEWADDLLKNKRLTKLLGIEGEAGSNGARGKIGRAFWFRAALFSTVFYNLINAAFREKDRKENPKKYPEKMTPADYSIWANSYPMDNIYDRIMPKVFIGRNSDGTARMLRVGKQFREVPEMLSEPVTKLGGKTSPLINVSSQVGLGMSPSDFINRAMGEEAYLNQDIWDGYGMDAEKKEGLELAKGRAVTLGKSLVPYIGSRYISGKHEFSTWDFVAQTNAGASKGKVFKQTKEALKQGKPEKIDEIEMRAYQDGLSYKDIRQMVGYAKLDYKAENTKKYKKKLINSFENKDEKEYDRVMKKMQRKHLSQEEQRRIREKAWEDYTNK